LSSPRRSADAPVFDQLRRREYARLGAGGHVYLDYTGTGLYAEAQLAEHLELLQRPWEAGRHGLPSFRAHSCPIRASKSAC
jgi:hypothetical protein